MIRSLIILLSCVTSVLAQPTPMDKWQQELSAYYAHSTPVKLHLFFNQPAYAPGDTAYFRAAFVTASDNTPVEGNQIITLDVVHESGEILLRQEFRMNNGWSGNQLVIPADFTRGVFRVIAYNDWMKNFDHHAYFQSFLEITGPVESERVPKKLDLSCYAEGGNLVVGLKTKIVVFAGKSEMISVVDSKENRITELTTNEVGLGFFFLTPAALETYKVISSVDTVTLNPIADGFSILFTPGATAKANHRLIIQAAEESSWRNQDVTLIISRHDRIYYSAILRFENKEFIAMNIDPTLLPEGLCHLSINSTTGNMLASRLFYNSTNKTINPEITIPKTTYGTRQPVQIDFSLSDKDDNPMLARISVSVYRKDLFKNYPHHAKRNFARYLFLDSDLPSGNDEIQLNNFDQPNYLDLFLLTQHWPWYSWGKILQPRGRLAHDLRDYQILSGRLINSQTGEPIQEAASVTFYFSGIGKIYTTFTNDQGVFEAFLLFDFFDDERVFYHIEKDDRKLENASIKINKLESVQPGVSVSGIFVPRDSSRYFAYHNKTNGYIDSYKFFYEHQKLTTSEASNPNSLLEKLVNGVDLEVDLDDYLLFPTMKETLTEVVPFLRNIKFNGKDAVYVYRPDNPSAINLPPHFIIDGIVTDDYTYFLNLNPANVNKIKLVQSAKKLQQLDVLGKNGFVVVETKLQRSDVGVLQNNQHLTIKGLVKEISFPQSLSQWQSDNVRAPRFKSTLFWSANELLDNQGHAKFLINTTDDTGNYVVRIEGLTTTGIPFVVEKGFEVKYDQ